MAACGEFLQSTREAADLNQYWFSQFTIETFVAEIVDCGGRSALVSSPSVYFSLPPQCREVSKVLDFDRQWQDDPGYVFYDFNAPEDLPPKLLHAFDFVLVDPPFITHDVWAKYATTAKLLLREGGRLLCTTIAENAPMMQEFLGLSPAMFRPSIPNLVYQYSLYANYASPRLDRLNAEVDAEDWRMRAAEAPEAAPTEAPLAAAGLGAEATAEAAMRAAGAAVEAPGPPPPGVEALAELRRRLLALKRSVDALLGPKRGGAPTKAAMGAAEAAALSLQAWLAQPGTAAELATALGEAEDSQPDRWRTAAVLELVRAARGDALREPEARLAWALDVGGHGDGLFRLAGQAMEAIKRLKRQGAQSQGN